MNVLCSKRSMRLLLMFMLSVTLFMCINDVSLAASLEPTHYGSGAVSELNDKPNTYVNTGNQVDDLLGVAYTQLGYYRLENTVTKYGKWYGIPDGAWCAMFISWCVKQAGIDNNIIKSYCNCTTGANWFKAQSLWYNRDDYVPKAGDIIFYNTNNGSRINHTGIVLDVMGNKVITIEGNYRNSVNITSHLLSDRTIMGYGCPRYKTINKTDVTGSAIDVKYSSHVQLYGWLDYVSNGEQSGTTGEAKRLEAIRIGLTGITGITYRVHCQTYGWLDYVADGELAGTVGESRRLEAIEIQLSDELAEQYDIYYRSHVQTYGWLDWVKNGEQSGTTGESRRLEAIEIQIVAKGCQPE